MALNIRIQIERFPIAGAFTISRGTKTVAEVIVCTLVDGDYSGRGECVPYQRYGETVDSVRASIAAARSDVINGITRDELRQLMPAGAARNAIDCALWDLEAKRDGLPSQQVACQLPPRPVSTAFTIALAEPEEMAAQARAAANRPVLKVKVGAGNDAARIHAVVSSAPNSRIILDANEGWNDDNIRQNLLLAAEFRVALVEQPLPVGNDAILRDIPHPVPICADESIHTTENLDNLTGLYDAVNIKLDKTGGLTEALDLRDRARELGFGVMVGCMVGSSLAMAPAVLLAQDADYVDLDGPLLLARDRSPGLTYSGSVVSPPRPLLWG